MNGIGRAMARAHGLDERGWERHAAPWSVWTRVAILPLGALAVWARVWIGWWFLLPLAALVVWSFVNPRAFPPPVTTRTWSARAVMGERVWLARGALPIPEHHARMAAVTSGIAAAGLPLAAWGLWRLELWPLLLGLALCLVGKFWFIDRMVWLFEDMAREDPIYRAWLR